MTDLWPWAALILLGAFHGVNPAMGWLFAVGLGLQERSRGAVLRALVPIALGHAVSIAVVAGAAEALRGLVAPRILTFGAAGVLLVFGAYRLLRGVRHRSRTGMRVGFPGLALWSFLAATAHGAGLMVVPALLGLPVAGGTHGAAGHAGPHLADGAAPAPAAVLLVLAAVGVHTASLLAVSAAIAVIVFDRVGLGILRKAWINLDLIWAAALLAAGAVLLLMM